MYLFSIENVSFDTVIDLSFDTVIDFMPTGMCQLEQ